MRYLNIRTCNLSLLTSLLAANLYIFFNPTKKIYLIKCVCVVFMISFIKKNCCYKIFLTWGLGGWERKNPPLFFPPVTVLSLFFLNCSVLDLYFLLRPASGSREKKNGQRDTRAGFQKVFMQTFFFFPMVLRQPVKQGV